jgi:hypothetical protein
MSIGYVVVVQRLHSDAYGLGAGPKPRQQVQRDALESMGALFERVGDESSGRLSSKKSRLSSRLSSDTQKSGP